MKRSVMAWVAVGTMVVSGAYAAEPEWITQSNQFTRLLLDVNARYAPEGVADAGLEQYDAAILDLKPGYAERQEADLAAVAAKLEAARPTVTDPRTRQDLDILIKSANDQVTTSALNRRLMIPYIDVGKTVFQSMQLILDQRVSKKRQQAALVRLKRYAGTGKGYEPLTKLAEARVQERVTDGSLTWPWENEVKDGLDNSGTYVDGIHQLLRKSGLKGWQKDFDALTRELKAHDEWVKSTVLPRARKTNLLPPEIYADNLKGYGVDADPRDLMQNAMTAYLQARDELDTLAQIYAAQKGYKASDYRSVIRELKKNRIPEDQVLAVYKSHLAQIEAIVRKEGIVTPPQRNAAIRLGTPAENAASPAPHLNTPRLIGNTGEPAEFVLTLTNASGGQMDDFSNDAISWTIIAHECRPGHELQFAGMIERGVSNARAIYAFNSANVEGWALYAEAVMKQYLPLEGQIGALQMRMLRAARAFLDPMLNLGLIEPDAAKRILVDDVMLSEPFATSEVNRYTFVLPGQATAYFYGYSRLQALRTRTELAMGSRFNQKAYHDFIISQGLLPLSALEKAVETGFVGEAH